MASAGKTVSELALAVGGELISPTSEDLSISDVTHDSRQAGPGTMFVAMRGAASDGHDFARTAVEAGSPAICVDHPLMTGVPEIVVADTRSALGPLSATVHGNPSEAMKVIGVTGTNGKTTVTHYLESMAIASGHETGLVGTIATHIAGETIESIHTTPEASDFQRLLARMRDSGVDMVAAEVSSHALDLGRVASTSFAVGAFTNLSQDHLDFHGDMDTYRRTKQRFFEEYEIGVAVVNVDDPAGREIASGYRRPLMTVGAEGEFGHGPLVAVTGGTAFTFRTPEGSADVVAPVVGSFNVDNAVLAATCGIAAGIEFDGIVAGLHTLAGVPGRFEVVSGDDPIMVVVDYAHTPEGVELAIAAARGMQPRRVIALIGAGGDRDRDKRPLMGAAASAADLTVITSDNPRSEDPAEIIRAVEAGLDSVCEAVIEIDRARAIEAAIRSASDGDVVLVLGRGHEPLQEIDGEKIRFDDREVAREALFRRRSADSGGDSGSMAP